MFAIIEVGAKQFTVKKGDTITVEKLDALPQEEVVLDKVLLLSKDKKVEVGQPYVKEARVTAEVLRQLKGEKKITFKYRRRKASHTKRGHRQRLTQLRIKEISAEG